MTEPFSFTGSKSGLIVPVIADVPASMIDVCGVDTSEEWKVGRVMSQNDAVI